MQTIFCADLDSRLLNSRTANEYIHSLLWLHTIYQEIKYFCKKYKKICPKIVFFCAYLNSKICFHSWRDGTREKVEIKLGEVESRYELWSRILPMFSKFLKHNSTRLTKSKYFGKKFHYFLHLNTKMYLFLPCFHFNTGEIFMTFKKWHEVPIICWFFA